MFRRVTDKILLTNLPPEETEEAARIYDNEIMEALLGIAGGTLLKKLLLPVQIEDPEAPHFGVEIASALHIAPAAYQASLAATNTHIPILTAGALHNRQISTRS